MADSDVRGNDVDDDEDDDDDTKCRPATGI